MVHFKRITESKSLATIILFVGLVVTLLSLIFQVLDLLNTANLIVLAKITAVVVEFSLIGVSNVAHSRKALQKDLSNDYLEISQYNSLQENPNYLMSTGTYASVDSVESPNTYKNKYRSFRSVRESSSEGLSQLGRLFESRSLGNNYDKESVQFQFLNDSGALKWKSKLYVVTGVSAILSVLRAVLFIAPMTAISDYTCSLYYIFVTNILLLGSLQMSQNNPSLLAFTQEDVVESIPNFNKNVRDHLTRVYKNSQKLWQVKKKPSNAPINIFERSLSNGKSSSVNRSSIYTNSHSDIDYAAANRGDASSDLMDFSNSNYQVNDKLAKKRSNDIAIQSLERRKKIPSYLQRKNYNDSVYTDSVLTSNIDNQCYASAPAKRQAQSFPTTLNDDVLMKFSKHELIAKNYKLKSKFHDPVSQSSFDNDNNTNSSTDHHQSSCSLSDELEFMRSHKANSIRSITKDGLSNGAQESVYDNLLKGVSDKKSDYGKCKTSNVNYQSVENGNNIFSVSGTDLYEIDSSMKSSTSYISVNDVFKSSLNNIDFSINSGVDFGKASNRTSQDDFYAKVTSTPSGEKHYAQIITSNTTTADNSLKKQDVKDEVYGNGGVYGYYAD